MALPLVTAAVALFYLGAVPVRIAVRWQSGTGLGVGVALFESRFALRRAQRIRPPRPKRLPENIDLTAALRAGKGFLRHIHLEEIRLSGCFGCDDAAATALICGGVNALGYALRARSKSVLVGLQPDFNTDRLSASLYGMICVRVGHIMLAALFALIEYASGRLNSWTSTPSKAL